MLFASWIEFRAAGRAARLACHVVVDRQLGSTGAAQHCFLHPLIAWPNFNFVFGERLVAVLTCIVKTAAFHLDGNDVGGCVVVDAPGLSA